VELSPAQVHAGVAFPRASCDVSGAVIRTGPVGAVVPAPGTAVRAVADGVDGGAELVISTSPTGDVQVNDAAAVTGSSSVAAPSATAAATCGGAAYTTYGAKWYVAPTFRINAASHPKSVTQTQWVNNITSAAATWANGVNRCGYAQTTNSQIKVTSAGTTTRLANISDNATCQTPDGLSVVSAGNLPGSDATGGTYGYTCLWWTTGSTPNRITEADVKMDGVDWTYIPTGAACNNHLDLLSGLTHELGHFVGLNHVSEATYPTLVMSPTINRCEVNRKLGDGDYKGRASLYFAP
jgi:hypothetical protein